MELLFVSKTGNTYPIVLQVNTNLLRIVTEQ
jgi:hypothetical protein